MFYIHQTVVVFAVVVAIAFEISTKLTHWIICCILILYLINFIFGVFVVFVVFFLFHLENNKKFLTCRTTYIN